MNQIIIIVLLIFLFIYYFNKQKDTFDTQIVKKTLINTWGEILDINSEPIIKKFDNSTKYSVSNIIRTIPSNDHIFNHKININKQFDNFGNIINQLNYNHTNTEHINNHPTGVIIGNDFSVDNNQLSYGFTITFNPEEINYNYAYIGIEMKSYNKNLPQKSNLSDMSNRKIIEIFTSNNNPSELNPYFFNEIKYLGIFEEQDNIDFIKSFPNRYFNLLDLYGNRILTKCKINFPYCNIELPVKGNIRGRNGYIVGKYSPNDKAVKALYQNNEFLKYENITECNVNRDNHKKLFENPENTKIMESENDFIKSDKELIQKHFIDKTEIKCRENSSDYNNSYFYGGLNKCLEDDLECKYFENEENCNTEIDKLENIEFVKTNRLLESSPLFIPKDEQYVYNKYNELNCINTTEKEVTCKHIFNKVLSDIVTFNIDEAIENDAKEIIENREVLKIRHPKSFGELTLEQENEYLKNKYFIEPYSKETEKDNPLLTFQNIRYFLKLKKYYDGNKLNTIAEVIKINNNNKFEFVAQMNDRDGVCRLIPDDKIYIYITKDNKMIFSIIRNNLVISNHTIKDKLKGDFGSQINYYIATNNKNIFEKAKYTQNVNGYVIPYLSDVKINIINE